jgi:hypothetical protein
MAACRSPVAIGGSTAVQLQLGGPKSRGSSLASPPALWVTLLPWVFFSPFETPGVMRPLRPSHMVFFGFMHCVVFKCSDGSEKCNVSIFMVTELVPVYPLGRSKLNSFLIILKFFPEPGQISQCNVRLRSGRSWVRIPAGAQNIWHLQTVSELSPPNQWVPNFYLQG